MMDRTMKETIDTTRFGQIEIDQERIIHFPQGLLGFPDHKDYVVFEHKPDSPFCWLQSLDSPELAFVLTNPFHFNEQYLEDISSEDKKSLPKENGANLVVFALVTIPPGKVQKMTVNLLGPLFIDAETRTGRQVILASTGYSHHHPLINN